MKRDIEIDMATGRVIEMMADALRKEALGLAKPREKKGADIYYKWLLRRVKLIVHRALRELDGKVGSNHLRRTTGQETIGRHAYILRQNEKA